MKQSFSFIRIINWLYLVRTKLKLLRKRLDEEELTREEIISLLEEQKKLLFAFKDILESKAMLMGIQQDFLTNFQQIKKEYGIED